jgi:hypothetical protein
MPHNTCGVFTFVLSCHVLYKQRAWSTSSFQEAAMSRADDVAQKVREAADHPKASLLFAIGAERPSPQSAASKAYALGLANKEEQLAKWLAVLKRDAEKLFGKPFLETLRDILKEGESEMETRRGKGFFTEKAKPLIKQFMLEALRDGVPFDRDATPEKFGDGKDVSCDFRRTRIPGDFYPVIDEKSNLHLTPAICIRCDESNLDFRTYLTSDSGLEHLNIHVSDKRAMRAVRKFGHVWERKSKQLKGSQVAHVRIYQDFA